MMFVFSQCQKIPFALACWAFLAAVFAAPAQAEMTPAQLHPKAQKLVDTIESLLFADDYAKKLEMEKRLWAEFKRLSYTATLTQRQKNLYDAALEAKDCDQVKKMQFAAFERTFPYLKPAFQSIHVYESHMDHLIGRLSDVTYCDGWHDIERILRLIRIHQLNLLPFDYSSEENELRQPNSLIHNSQPWLDENSILIDRARNSLCWKLLFLFRRATNEANPHAVREIMQLAERRDKFHFTPVQLYAVYLRGMHLGILRDVDEKRLKQLYRRIKPRVRSKIDTLIDQLQSSPGTLPIETRRCRSPSLTLDEHWGRE